MKQGNAQRLGFSLLEITIVLLIMGALLASGASSFSAQSTKNQRAKNQLYLESIRDALIWYAKGRGRLPCPDIDGDGLGDLTDTNADDLLDACTARVGVLPWNDLEAPNVKGLDVWGHYFTYHIGETFASDAACLIANRCVIQIRETEVAGTLLADDAPAAVVSHGKNGQGYFRFESAVLVPEPPDVNATLSELENADGVVEDGTAAEIIYLRGAGDDMLIWLSQAALRRQP